MQFFNLSFNFLLLFSNVFILGEKNWVFDYYNFMILTIITLLNLFRITTTSVKIDHDVIKHGSVIH